MLRIACLFLLLWPCFVGSLRADSSADDLRKNADDWFSSEEGQSRIENILSTELKNPMNYVGDVPFVVKTLDGLAGENLGLLDLTFNCSPPFSIA
jgi:hypothetical protein